MFLKISQNSHTSASLKLTEDGTTINNEDKKTLHKKNAKIYSILSL